MNSINWPASSVWVFVAQLGEHCSANAKATGSNPVEAPKIFFSGYFRNCLNCDSLRWSHTHFICIPAVHIISFTDFLFMTNSPVLKNHLIFHHAFKTFWKRHKKGRPEIYVADTTIRSSILGFVTGVVYWFFHEGRV